MKHREIKGKGEKVVDNKKRETLGGKERRKCVEPGRQKEMRGKRQRADVGRIDRRGDAENVTHER